MSDILMMGHVLGRWKSYGQWWTSSSDMSLLETKSYANKMAKYGEGCSLAGMYFLPLPMDTLLGSGMSGPVKMLESALVQRMPLYRPD